MPVNVVVNPFFDWGDDRPPRTPYHETVIYEAHVRGLTMRHPDLIPEERGTYAGLAHPAVIEHLTALGVTAVELMPVHQFVSEHALQQRGLANYWGYNTIAFLAPHNGYAAARQPGGQIAEFKAMVRALHEAGIEVVLDVVFNHTAEGDHRGPTLSFRGFENDAYYILEQDRSRFATFSGTGNTLNSNHPIVRRMILDSLRYWVGEMHVDGFRFDLASILARDSSGQLMSNPPVLWDIESDPALAGTKFIAEAWDAGGLYQVGSFVGDSWKEWNGRFRDDVRDFWRSEENTAARIADRILGSPEIY